MKKNDLIKVINDFFLDKKEINYCSIEYIYNEASLQFELGNYLRNKEYLVEFERNISKYRFKYKNNNKSEDEVLKNFIKKEIDLVVYNKDKSKKIAIELKFPINGQVPEQMFSFIKDIKFNESLRDGSKLEDKFDDTIFLVVTNDSKFWTRNNKKYNERKRTEKYYKMFRVEKGRILRGEYEKPTGDNSKNTKIIELKEDYDFIWKESHLKDSDKKFKFFIV